MLHLTPSRLVAKSAALLEINGEDAPGDTQVSGINTICYGRCQKQTISSDIDHAF